MLYFIEYCSMICVATVNFETLVYCMVKRKELFNLIQRMIICPTSMTSWRWDINEREAKYS